MLASSEDYGKDLTGVQNLRRKHQRLEAEIHNHEPKVLVSRKAGLINSLKGHPIMEWNSVGICLSIATKFCK